MKTKQRILLLMVVCLTTFISCTKTSTSNPLAPADARDQYVGYWQVHDSIIGASGNNYLLTITKSNVSDGYIQLYNIENLALMATAKVNNDSFNIPKQAMGNNNISGSGIITSGNSISFNYTWFSSHIAKGAK